MSSQRFAEWVLARFRELGLETDTEVADAGGPSSTTMTKIRAAAHGGDLPRPRSDTASRIDAAAQWVPGSARRLYDGLTPQALDVDAAGLIERIRRSDDFSDREKRTMIAQLSQGQDWAPPDPPARPAKSG